MKSIVFYHGNCLDGALAAWVWKLGMWPDAELVPCVYQATKPEHHIPAGEPHRIAILDFSFDPGQVASMMVDAEQVVLLDHHESARRKFDAEGVGEVFEALPNAQRIRDGESVVAFSQADSGAGMAFAVSRIDDTADYGHLVLAVQDRDLWKWQFPDSRAITAALEILILNPQDFAKFTGGEGRDRLRMAGELLITVKDREVQRILGDMDWPVAFLAGHKVQLIPCPGWHASEVGNAVMSIKWYKYPFVALYRETESGGVKVSLRSSDEHPDIDVGQIASRFGGGGHANAAGFEYRSAAALYEDLESGGLW